LDETAMQTPSQPTPDRLPPGARPVACVDIGGTKVAVSVADEQGLRARVVEATATQGNRGALAQQIIALIGQSCALAGLNGSDIAAVGVASCLVRTVDWWSWRPISAVARPAWRAGCQ
jgi:glucokinase